MAALKMQIIYPYDLFGDKIGGAETFVKELIKYAPDDIPLEYIGITSGAGLKLRQWHTVMFQGKRIKYYPVLFEKNENQKSRMPLSLRFALRLAGRNIGSENAVCFFNRLEPAIVYGQKAKVRIAVQHNDINQQLRAGQSELLWSKMPRLYAQVEKKIIRTMDYVYTVSTQTLETYREKYGRLGPGFGLVSVWVDMKKYCSSLESAAALKRKIAEKYRLNRESVAKPWMLFVGRLQKQKAPKRLVDTFVVASGRLPGLEFYVIGDGNELESTKKYAAQKGGELPIHFMGGLRSEDIREFYRASDVLLLASHFEGQPIVVLEALACGLPVVATNVGDIRRFVKDRLSGRLVDSVEPGEIAAAVVEIIKKNRIRPHACIEAVKPYVPEKIIPQIYDRIRTLYAAKA